MDFVKHGDDHDASLAEHLSVCIAASEVTN